MLRLVGVVLVATVIFVGGVYFGQASSTDYRGMIDRAVRDLAAMLEGNAVDVDGSAADLDPSAPVNSAREGAAEHAPASPNTDSPPKVVARLGVASFKPDETLAICPRITVSNRPATNARGLVTDYAPFVLAEGRVVLATVPTNGACLSSGFGPRNGKSHKGVDFQSEPASMIHAAGSGRIVEAGYRNDFGNYVIVDHGQDVFTRYAHLQALRGGIEAGRAVELGTPLGLMGQSAGYRVPVHLHYEVLVGDYDTPKKSFGLSARNILSYPAFMAVQ